MKPPLVEEPAEQPLLPPYTNWGLLDNWLAYLQDKKDIFQTADETHLEAFILAFQENPHDPELEKHFALIQGRLASHELTFSERQMKRLMYWGALVRLMQCEWTAALDQLRQIEVQDDPIAQLEVNRWIATATLNSHNFLRAYQACADILTYEEAHDIEFSKGDIDSFHIHWYFMRSMASYGLLQLDESQQDLICGLTIAHEWIAEYGRKPMARRKTSAAEDHMLSPAKDFALDLEDYLPPSILTSDDPDIIAWLKTYHELCWNLGNVVFWIGRHAEGMPSLAWFRQAEAIMKAVMKMCGDIPPLRSQRARVATLYAEILLSHCDRLPDIDSEWHHLFGQAESMISLAEQQIDAQSVNPLERDMPNLTRYLRAMTRFTKACANGDEEGLQNLAKEVRDLYLDSMLSKQTHLIGRCCFLLGCIHKELDLYEHANDNFLEAIKVFHEEGNEVRADEAERMRKNLPNW